MDQQLQSMYGASSDMLAVRHRVLRNTYWLLALSMIPTVFGAWLGLQMHFSLFAGSPMISFIAFLAIAFGFFYAIEKTKDSAIGVEQILHFSNGGSLIMTAFGGTAIIFTGMATIATTSKRDFSGLGSWLFAGVIVILLAGVANIFLQMPLMQVVISTIAVAIFSAYILVDVQRIINGGETNYITATLAIYLDIYNIFVHLLALLGILGGERD